MTELPPIVEFITARLNEKQRLAEAARDRPGVIGGGTWTHYFSGVVDTGHRSHGGDHVTVTVDMSECDEEEIANHVVAHDPGRVLADIAAKRKLLHWCANVVLDGVDLTGMEKPGWSVHAAGPGRHVEVFTAALALRGLAASDAEHPDYVRSWRIEG